MKRYVRVILSILGLGIGIAQASNVSEYAVKAGYLSAFAGSVQWPEKTFSDPNAPIVVGIVGNDPFGSTLDKAVKGQTQGGRSLLVRRFDSFEQAPVETLRACHIVFIADSEQDNVREILQSLKASSALTVSEIEQFPRMGGIIQFNQEGNRIGLIVNPKVAKNANLKLGSELIKIAKSYVQVNATKAKALYMEGVTLYLKGEIKPAIAKWQECLEEDPGNRTAQVNLAKAQAKLKAIQQIR